MHDVEPGTQARRDLSAQRVPGEVVFAPAVGGTREDDGWLVGIATRASRDAAELPVLDAADLGRPPAASVQLPHRVPVGFHESWAPDQPGGEAVTQSRRGCLTPASC
jgi:carotenoid cleavage dioxygenase-like enzyme